MDKLLQDPRILVADDEPSHLEYVEELLQVGGYHTETAASGSAALARIRQDPPDLVVLDVGMPEMDGFEVCRQLKADARTATVPVLFLTGLQTPRDKEEGLLAGAEDYVTKPLDPTDLLTRVRALLRVTHLSRELDRTLASLQELELARRAPLPEERGAAGSGPTSAQGHEIGDLEVLRLSVVEEAPHVLVVDDDRVSRRLYASLLEDRGYGVSTAASAAEAYAVAAKGVDVILLDIIMAEVSGLEVLAHLQQIAPHVPIVIVTAFQTTQNAIAALRGGAFDVIMKGMKPELLLNSVARAAERHRLVAENRRLHDEARARMEPALNPSAAPAT